MTNSLPSLKERIETDAVDDTIKKHWIIVREPNCAPEKKHPIPNTYEGTLKMLRELFECRPAGTQTTIARLTWNNDLWVEDGREALAMDEAMAAYYGPRFRRKTKYRLRSARSRDHNRSRPLPPQSGEGRTMSNRDGIWIVRVVNHDTDDEVREIRCNSEREAERIERGLNINLDHRLYYTLIDYPDKDELPDVNDGEDYLHRGTFHD